MMANGPLILVADDQADNLLVLEELLEDRYRVLCVGDGLQLLDLIEEFGPPDLILMDVVMPGMDGFETCRQLKAAPATRDIPIIFLSGLDGSGDEEFGLSLGADDFIHKPFVAAVVLARVRNLLARKEAVRQERQIAVMESQLAEQRQQAQMQQQLIDRLTILNSELERFTYIAAHDLREPSRTLVNYGQLLQKSLAGKLASTEQDYLDHVVASARHMYDLVGGVLEFSRSPANLGVLQPVDSGEACQAALDRLGGLIETSEASVSIGTLPWVEADPMALLQIFQHLLGNALKFHRPGVAPKVAISAERQDEDWQFCIADNGTGFDAANQDPFELFRRAHPRDGYDGVGVGLAVCKRLLQALGGRIWAETTLGEGSRFYFTVKAVGLEG